MTEILIASAAASNYEGMDALVGEDGRVYLGRSENYCPGDGEAPAFYDNSDNSLQLISDNIKMFHFLYGEGWPVSQRQMRRERCFTKADYIEFASLRDGVLSHYRPIREVTFAGRPFVPPKAYLTACFCCSFSKRSKRRKKRTMCSCALCCLSAYS